MKVFKRILAVFICIVLAAVVGYLWYTGNQLSASGTETVTAITERAP